jgi:CRP-like cAMP-binding protein
MSSRNALERMARKLRTRLPLAQQDIDAILALPVTIRTHEAPGYLVREGATDMRYCSFVVSGFAIRQKLTAEGARQIVSLQLPGDFIDLQHLFLNHADHNVQALTRLETADIDRAALQALILSNPAIGKALWIDALIEASIAREWVLNVGRRDARQRIAHLICEFAVRMQAAGRDGDGRSELPMTQEQLGDAVGLTSVHVNRTLKSLAADGIVHRDRRHISFDNWDRVRAVGDFSALYLHLDQADPTNGDFDRR